MVKKKYNLLKAISWYTVGNILIKGISFFLLPVFTSLMSTYEYGVYSVYLSYLTIFETFILFGLSNTVSIEKYDDNMDFEEYMSAIVKIPLALTAAVLILVNIYFIFADSLLDLNQMLWNFLLLTAATSAVLMIIAARLVIEGRYTIYMIWSVGNTLLTIGFSLLLCYTAFRYNNIYYGRVIGALVPSVAFAIVYAKLFVKSYRLQKNVLKVAITLGFPLLLHTFSTVIMTQSDRVIIKMIDGYDNTGIYSIAVTLVSIPLIIQTSIGSAYTPWLFDHLKVKDYKRIRIINNTYIIGFSLVIAGFMIISPEIIRLFTNKAYWDASYSLIPLSISILFECFYSLAISVESFNKKTWMITTATVISTIINIILDVILIKLFGYHGAAYGTTIAKFMLFVMHWIFAKKVDSNSMFSTSLVLFISISMCGLNFAILRFIDIIAGRYIVLVTVMVLSAVYGLKRKNAIVDALKN